MLRRCCVLHKPPAHTGWELGCVALTSSWEGIQAHRQTAGQAAAYRWEAPRLGCPHTSHCWVSMSSLA